MAHVHDHAEAAQGKYNLSLQFRNALMRICCHRLISAGWIELGQVPGDGACFFHAWGAFLGLNGEAVRAKMYEWMHENSDQLTEAIRLDAEPVLKDARVALFCDQPPNPGHQLRSGLWCYSAEEPWAPGSMGRASLKLGKWAGNGLLPIVAGALELLPAIISGEGSGLTESHVPPNGVCIVHINDNHFRPLGCGSMLEETSNLCAVAQNVVDEVIQEWEEAGWRREDTHEAKMRAQLPEDMQEALRRGTNFINILPTSSKTVNLTESDQAET